MCVYVQKNTFSVVQLNCYELYSFTTMLPMTRRCTSEVPVSQIRGREGVWEMDVKNDLKAMASFPSLQYQWMIIKDI